MEKSRNSEVLHLTGLLDFRTSGLPDFWTSGLLDFLDFTSELPDFWTSYISLLDFLTLLYPRCLNEIADETDVGEERGHL